MSVNTLFSPNDLVLYAGQINSGSGGTTINGNLVVNGNENLNGDLFVSDNHDINMGGWLGSNAALPDHINLWNGTYGLGVTASNFNIVAPAGANINHTIGGSITTQTSGAGFQIKKILYDGSDLPGTDGQILVNNGGTLIEWQNISQQISLQSGSAVAPNNYIGNSSNSSIYSDCAFLCSKNMTITDLRFVVQAAPGVGNAYNFTLLKNSIITPLFVTIIDANTSAQVSGSLSFVPGDTFSVIYTLTGVPANPNVTIGVLYNTVN